MTHEGMGLDPWQAGGFYAASDGPFGQSRPRTLLNYPFVKYRVAQDPLRFPAAVAAGADAAGAVAAGAVAAGAVAAGAVPAAALPGAAAAVNFAFPRLVARLGIPPMRFGSPRATIRTEPNVGWGQTSRSGKSSVSCHLFFSLTPVSPPAQTVLAGDPVAASRV
ncbi:hypothetical protein PCL_08336 [Purpureocillium lilacinum]|uniref:Uncharacterized protein n=1 Tax=Purpureocillium lilacinum TaxID=33203 RepID=A0A2U3DRU5_PURLI|nr:hypothetical protein PCL_08336 [Purpureocillium lilacinum]